MGMVVEKDFIRGVFFLVFFYFLGNWRREILDVFDLNFCVIKKKIVFVVSVIEVNR